MPQQFIERLLDLIFPKFCVSCGKLFCFICENCYQKINFIPMSIRIELEPAYLDQLFVAANYQDPISKLIKTLKYQGVKNIAQLLGTMFWENSYFPKMDLITAVPIHQKRLRERGFNQSELIARKLASLAGIPYLGILKKGKHSKRQASSKNREQRLSQLIGSFSLSTKPKPISYLNKSIIIVDDVITTGATLNECAKVLKKVGLKKVIGLAVAHEA
ncbi:MAG: ComF family protein [Candidatus Woesebacteria bacterium]|jgi:ComF family protein